MYHNIDQSYLKDIGKLILNYINTVAPTDDNGAYNC